MATARPLAPARSGPPPRGEGVTPTIRSRAPLWMTTSVANWPERAAGPRNGGPFLPRSAMRWHR